jgi:uridine kinase
MTDPGHPRALDSPLLEAIAEFICHYEDKSLVRIGIDGVDGVGKTVFADMLAGAIRSRGRPVIRASVDGFHNPRTVRYQRGRASPEGFYLDSYNYGELRKTLLDPLGPNGSRRYCPAIFDHVTDSQIPMSWSVADPRSALIFDGIFLHRPELRNVWSLSVFLAASFDVTIPRCASRGPDWGSADVNAPSNQRYIEGQNIYLRDNEPQTRAHIVIDYSDFTNPFLIASRWPQSHTR